MLQKPLSCSFHLNFPSFKQPLLVRLKLAMRLRHLAIGESYISLGFHFVPDVCRSVFHELKEKFLVCSTIVEFYNRWIVPCDVGSMYGKHLVIKKARSKNYNFKGLFSLALSWFYG